MGMRIPHHERVCLQHVGAHLIKAGGGDQVAFSINLPRDWGEPGADLIVSRGASGGSSILGDIYAVVAMALDPTLHQVWVVVVFVVDDGEDLRLHAYLLPGVEPTRGSIDNVILAEDTIVERSLPLVYGPTGTSSRMRPMDFVGLSNLHSVGAKAPRIWSGESRVLRVVMVAPEAHPDCL